VVLTDSGGVQEEAFTLKVPTITLRYNTERPETILLGCNVLAGADEDRIVDCAHKMVELRENICSKLRDKPNPYGDGHAGEHIANVLEKAIKNGIALQSPDLRDKPLITYNLKSVKKVIASDEVLSLFDKKGKAVSEKRSAEKVVVRNAMDSKVY
jgi:UDP-N-acetylglucosamine 2-epimerase (non-hydrolysing)